MQIYLEQRAVQLHLDLLECRSVKFLDICQETVVVHGLETCAHVTHVKRMAYGRWPIFHRYHGAPKQFEYWGINHLCLSTDSLLIASKDPVVSHISELVQKIGRYFMLKYTRTYTRLAHFIRV